LESGSTLGARTLQRLAERASAHKLRETLGVLAKWVGLRGCDALRVVDAGACVDGAAVAMAAVPGGEADPAPFFTADA